MSAGVDLMAVERCVCRDVTFSELKELAETLNADLDTLSEHTGCGTGCGMCVPYIQVMLHTGMTRIPILDGPTYRALMARPPATATGT